MIYLSLALFVLAAATLPWWATALIGFAFGLTHAADTIGARLRIVLSSGLAWSAMAFVHDGRLHGLVSRRLAGLFGLPSPGLMFVVEAVVAMMTVTLALGAGASWRGLYDRHPARDRAS